MKTMILLFATLLLFFACGGTQKQMKTLTISEFSTKSELGEVVKDDLELKYSIGFYDNGSQKYFVGLKGYSSDGDTTHYDRKAPVKKEEKGNKTYFYAENGDIAQVSVTKGDTIYMYRGDDLEEAFRYEVYSNKKLIVEADLISEVKRTYTKAKYNENNACTYAVIIEDDLDEETSETIIFEGVFEYY